MTVEQVYEGELFKPFWQRITREQAQAINASFKDLAADDTTEFYTCTLYDAENKSCTIQDRKPRVCAGFPLYGGSTPPHTDRLPPGCGYRIENKHVNKKKGEDNAKEKEER